MAPVEVNGRPENVRGKTIVDELQTKHQKAWEGAESGYGALISLREEFVERANTLVTAGSVVFEAPAQMQLWEICKNAEVIAKVPNLKANSKNGSGSCDVLVLEDGTFFDASKRETGGLMSVLCTPTSDEAYELIGGVAQEYEIMVRGGGRVNIGRAFVVEGGTYEIFPRLLDTPINCGLLAMPSQFHEMTEPGVVYKNFVDDLTRSWTERLGTAQVPR